MEPFRQMVTEGFFKDVGFVLFCSALFLAENALHQKDTMKIGNGLTKSDHK